MAREHEPEGAQEDLLRTDTDKDTTSDRATLPTDLRIVCNETHSKPAILEQVLRQQAPYRTRRAYHGHSIARFEAGAARGTQAPGARRTRCTY